FGGRLCAWRLGGSDGSRQEGAHKQEVRSHPQGGCGLRKTCQRRSEPYAHHRTEPRRREQGPCPFRGSDNSSRRKIQEGLAWRKSSPQVKSTSAYRRALRSLY